MEFLVGGMSCNKCKEKIINYLTQIEGVKGVVINLESQIVQVVCENVERKILEEAILDLGFDLLA